MGIALPVVIALFGMTVIGGALVETAPPHWQAGELLLLFAFLAMVRECWRFFEEPRMAVRANDPLAGLDWLDDTAGSGAPRAGMGGAPPQLGAADEFARASANAAAAGAARQKLAAEIRPGQTVEQIAHMMLARAFHELSMQYHPDRGGDTEVMMRLNAARDLMLRSLRKDSGEPRR